MSNGSAPRTLLDAITGRNFASLKSVVAQNATMRALLPGGPIEVAGPGAITERIEAWFGNAAPFEVLDATIDRVADRYALRYRFRLRRPDAQEEAEIQQHLFVAAPGAQVESIDLLCSGFRPLEPPKEAVVRDFQAGTLGCGDGLTDQFRRHMKEVGIGDLLRVHTIDPSAKEDLPSLARMMGHAVRSVEAHSDGSLTITVERGR